MCGTCLKLTTKTPERRLWRRSCVFIFKFEHISHLALLILLLTLSMLMPDGLPFLLEITTLRFTCSKKMIRYQMLTTVILWLKSTLYF